MTEESFELSIGNFIFEELLSEDEESVLLGDIRYISFAIVDFVMIEQDDEGEDEIEEGLEAAFGQDENITSVDIESALKEYQNPEEDPDFKENDIIDYDSAVLDKMMKRVGSDEVGRFEFASEIRKLLVSRKYL